MRILSTTVEFPDRVVSNSDAIGLMEQNSRAGFSGDLPSTLKQASKLLTVSGIRTRRWLNCGEPFFPLTQKAVLSAVDQAGIKIADIDLLIHASVDRRVLEPGMSFLLAKSLGMHQVQCFDVLEACNSWLRAMDLASTYLAAKKVRRVLIVTTEFAIHEGQWGQNSLKLENEADLEWALPTLTLGESTTATIVEADQTCEWDCRWVGRPEFADLCLCPLPFTDPANLRMGSDDYQGRGGGVFISYARDLQNAGLPAMSDFLKQYQVDLSTVRRVFPHSHSRSCWLEIAKRAGMELPYYFVYPDYGNLISSSVPAAIALACRDKEFARGDRGLITVAAAGMSFGICRFTW